MMPFWQGGGGYFRLNSARALRLATIPLLCFSIFAARAESESIKSLKPKYTSMMTVSGMSMEDGYTGEERLENFPVLVRISTTKIPGFVYDKCDGEDDISFSDEDGKILPHEVEVWNTAGESVAWVSLPVMTNNAVFYMNWKHKTKLAEVKSNEVWDVATFHGVWHMADVSSIHDSSSSGRPMTVSAPSADSGVVTNGAQIGVAFFSKSSAASSAPDEVMNTGKIYMGYQSDCTLTGWIYLKGFTGTNANPFGPYKKCSTYYWSLYPGSSWTKTLLRFKTTASSTAVASIAPKSAGWFHYAIAIHKNAAFDLYINGNYAGSHTPGNAGYYKYADPLFLYLAGRPGYLDETRIRDELSSSDWIKAEYDSIKNTDFIVASAAVSAGSGLFVIVR